MFNTGRKLNGFNNGRDATDGIGGQPSYFDDMIDMQFQFVKDNYNETEKRALLYASGIYDSGTLAVDPIKESAFMAGAKYIIKKYNIKDE